MVQPVLQVGAARVDITPTTPQYLDGYGNRSTPHEGVYLPIYARALSFAESDGRALILSAEVLGYDREQAARIKRRVAEATGYPAEAIILTATHTHCAPRVCQMVMPGEIDAAYVARFEAALVEAAVSAVAGMGEAQVFRSTAEGTLGVNRRFPTDAGMTMRPNLDAPNDNRVHTVWFRWSDGAPLGSLTVYACHPTSRGGLLIGGDYPGFLSHNLEQEHGGVALFALGCAGDIRPHFTDETGGFRQAEVAEVEAAGRTLTDRVVAAPREHVAPCGVRAARAEITLPFEDIPSREALAATADSDPAPLRREWARRMLASDETPASVGFEIQTLRLAPSLAFVFLAGEMVVDYALALAPLHASEDVIPIGYSNGSVGYVPSRRIHPEGGYEVNGSHYYYAQPAPFAPEVEDLILDTARQLLDATR